MAMSVGIGASVALVAPAAHGGCALELVPTDAPPAWVAAATAARDRLERTATPDCRAIEVAVRPNGGALVTFTTTEGRMALRALMAAEELGPALEALLATLPPEEPAAASEVSAPPTARAATSGGTVAEPDRAGVLPALASPPIAAAPKEVHFNVGATGGVRLGVSGVYVSPAMTLRPSGTFGPWELAGVAEYDPTYTYLPAGTPAFSLWSFGAALQVGRREKLGVLVVGYGVSLGLSSVHLDTKGANGDAQVAEYAQPRVGAYGRLAAPRTGAWRGILDLGVDAALGSLKRRATLRSDLPDLPRWGIVAALGVETSLL